MSRDPLGVKHEKAWTVVLHGSLGMDILLLLVMRLLWEKDWTLISQTDLRHGHG